jgi:hypothetical protein
MNTESRQKPFYGGDGVYLSLFIAPRSIDAGRVRLRWIRLERE